MKIVLVHLGPISQLISATSVMAGIKKQKVDSNITWVVSNDNLYIRKYIHARVISLEKFINEKGFYDLLINLWPFFPNGLKVNSAIRDFTGFYFDESLDKKYKDAILGNSFLLNMSILQLYFRLCGLVWRGEGYGIGYYPKTRTRQNRVGISVANANLRNYVLDNLKVENMKVWYIPYKKNIFKKMDEINRCKKVITDDLLTFHLAMSMRKYVYYLKTHPMPLDLETFGNGEVHSVPLNVFQ